MSSRTCPDWPKLMEIAPELQFKHYTVAEAKLPAEALAHVQDMTLNAVAICCGLNPAGAAIRGPDGGCWSGFFRCDLSW